MKINWKLKTQIDQIFLVFRFFCSFECANPNYQKIESKRKKKKSVVCTTEVKQNANKMPSANEKKIDLFSLRIQCTTKRVYGRFYIYWNFVVYLKLEVCVMHRAAQSQLNWSFLSRLDISILLMVTRYIVWHDGMVWRYYVLVHVLLYRMTVRTYGKRACDCGARLCVWCVCVRALCLWISYKNTSKHVCQFHSLVPVIISLMLVYWNANCDWQIPINFKNGQSARQFMPTLN